MTLLTRTKLTFEQFLRDYPDGTGPYELINGALVEMRSARGHDQIADGLLFAFNDEIRQGQLPFKVTNKVVIRTVDAAGQEQGRVPDVTELLARLQSTYRDLDLS